MTEAREKFDGAFLEAFLTGKKGFSDVLRKRLQNTKLKGPLPLIDSDYIIPNVETLIFETADCGVQIFMSEIELGNPSIVCIFRNKIPVERNSEVLVWGNCVRGEVSKYQSTIGLAIRSQTLARPICTINPRSPKLLDLEVSQAAMIEFKEIVAKMSNAVESGKITSGGIDISEKNVGLEY